jgi:hypothetical protein
VTDEEGRMHGSLFPDFERVYFIFCFTDTENTFFFINNTVLCLELFCTATCRVSGYPRQVIKVDAA